MSTINEPGIAYDDVGDGPAVVLLHGYPFNRSLWREQVEALKGRYRVITPDLRGHGESSVETSPATMEDMARDVAELLDQLKVGRATIAGLSMGGYVTLAYYRLFPQRVRAMVLADTRSQADTEEGKKTRATQAEQALREGMEPIAAGMLTKLFAPDTVAQRPDVVKRVREMMVQTKPEGAAAALAGMGQRQDQRDLLPRIVVPTLIIVGEHDAITPVADSEAMHRTIPGSRLEVVRGAGHVSNVEKPEEFNRVLLDFLRSVDQ